MHRWFAAFVAGLGVGIVMTAVTYSSGQTTSPAPSSSSVVQLRLYTIDKGRLDAFAAAWVAGVYPLRLNMGYRIPFAATIPQTNQFIWLLTYDGQEPWEKKEEA